MTSRAATLAIAAEAPVLGEAAWGEGVRAAAPATVDWDAMSRRYGRRVVVSLLARGVGPERAKELAQEAWIRVIEAHRAGRLAELRLPGVVIAQASFLALDDRRRHDRRAAHETPLPGASRGAPLEEASDGRGLEEQVAARDELRRILAVVERSHPNARRVFELLYGGRGLSAGEIAAELGLSVQRVRQITCELRQRIRRELRGGGRRG